MNVSNPKEGLGVLHLFYKVGSADRSAIVNVTEKFKTVEFNQVVFISTLGHKSDLCIMALSKDLWELRQLQSDLNQSGLDLVNSYVSLTEVSEYADGMPEEMKQTRLYPNLPPEGMNAWCFYPMSKRRNVEQNWYTTPYNTRNDLMHEHGSSGRKFRGRVVQLVTGSTGLDDYEWGVTLFAQHPDDLKEAVYTMRFDEASAIFGEFGWFCTGNVSGVDEVLDSLNVL